MVPCNNIQSSPFKKPMALKLLKFQENFFLLNQPNLKKLDLCEKFLFRWEILKLKLTRKLKIDHVICDLYTFAVR